MRKYDISHIAYHTLVAVFFIWFVVFGVLLTMTLNNYFEVHNQPLSKILLTWILLNLFMGTALFIVIQQFKKRTLLSRVLFYSYFFMVAASVSVIMIVV